MSRSILQTVISTKGLPLELEYRKVSMPTAQDSGSLQSGADVSESQLANLEFWDDLAHLLRVI